MRSLTGILGVGLLAAVAAGAIAWALGSSRIVVLPVTTAMESGEPRADTAVAAVRAGGGNESALSGEPVGASRDVVALAPRFEDFDASQRETVKALLDAGQPTQVGESLVADTLRLSSGTVLVVGEVLHSDGWGGVEVRCLSDAPAVRLEAGTKLRLNDSRPDQPVASSSPLLESRTLHAGETRTLAVKVMHLFDLRWHCFLLLASPPRRQ